MHASISDEQTLISIHQYRQVLETDKCLNAENESANETMPMVPSIVASRSVAKCDKVIIVGKIEKKACFFI